MLPGKRAEESKGLWARGRFHNARRDMGRLEETSACSGGVPNDGAVRFRAADARGSSGDGLLADSLCESRGKRAQCDAPRRGEARELGESGGELPSRRGASKNGRGNSGFRRAISSAWRRNPAWKRRGNEEGRKGFIAMGLGREFMALNALNRGGEDHGRFPN